MDVPLEKAIAVAQKYGDDGALPQPTELALKAIARAARKKAAEFEQRKFKLWCASNGLPLPEPEFKFHPTRNWRADYAWVNPDGGGVLLEVEGGVYSRGRHVRPKGYLDDMEKYSAASALGYRLVRVTPKTLCTTDTLEMLRPLLTLEAS